MGAGYWPRGIGIGAEHWRGALARGIARNPPSPTPCHPSPPITRFSIFPNPRLTPITQPTTTIPIPTPPLPTPPGLRRDRAPPLLFACLSPPTSARAGEAEEGHLISEEG